MCSAFLDLAILAELGGAGEIHREDDLHTLLADRVRAKRASWSLRSHRRCTPRFPTEFNSLFLRFPTEQLRGLSHHWCYCYPRSNPESQLINGSSCLGQILSKSQRTTSTRLSRLSTPRRTSTLLSQWPSFSAFAKISGTIFAPAQECRKKCQNRDPRPPTKLNSDMSVYQDISVRVYFQSSIQVHFPSDSAGINK